MEKLLRLKIYVDGGVNDTPFPNSDNPIEIGAFRYDAKRMGGAPIITASVNYPSCLDAEWTDSVYAEFNGEKYYLKQTPTSSYDNESVMYKHSLELVSERSILDNVYFFDTVVGDPQDEDKPVSDSTKVVFFGNIQEFVARLNSSLEYSGLDYTAVVDEDADITTEEKLMSFEDQFFSNVLQEIYKTYEVPYYFEGKTIHIGKSMPLGEGEEIPTFSYGVDDALLSITKNNANYKIVNRVTGTGSSDNIPFYYPNNSPKGEIAVDTTSTGATFTIIDGEAFSNEVGIGDVVLYGSGFARGLSLMFSDDGNKWTSYNGEALPITITNMKPVQKWFLYTFQVDTEGRVKIGGTVTIDSADTRDFLEFLTFAEITNRHGRQRVSIEDGYIDCGRLDAGSHTLKIGYSFPYLGRVNYTIATTLGTDMASGWYNETQEKETSLAKMGLAYSGTLASGDTITQRLVRYVKTSQNLMPSIYRESNGAERFYNAVNGEDGYQDESGNAIVFNNPYVEGRPKEHIITVEDIKPTIKGTEVNGLRIDMFSEFAYDEDDNDETYEDEEGNVYFKHPYFYGKLRIMDFNLFDHAIENQPMTISFTSGDCGACNFEIGVTEEYPQKNPVQVDANGNLLRDENGMVLAGVEGTQQDVTTFQDRQQDTSKYEVWIALKKEEDTYGILMPQGLHKPKAARSEDGTLNNEGDTFVILGINLPESYIINAEKKLEAEIIKYLKDNNDEKFTFSIAFSRIYFAENESVLESLSENSKIAVMYDGQRYELYVSSFSYNMAEGDTLPEIRVELDETLKVSQNALQNAISQVKSELGRVINNIDVVGAASPYFLRKDADDEAQGKINFVKGIKFGEGGKVEVMDNNSAKLTIEYLEVTKKASFTSLEIQEKTHVGGQILVTPAAINCGEVEELEDAYRCYFQTKGTDGDEIFNQFAVGDQAICQTYNAWGSKYYWRLVTGVGEDYIDLSKTECDEESGIPQAGDKIIQLGNQVDEARQNAIVIAAYGDGSPYIIQYKGINSFEIGDDKIVTKLSSTENIFTGIVHIKEGSDGFGELGDFADIIKESIQGVEVGGHNMLRNSGFTGDYLSAQLADNTVIEATDKMFNPPLVHWTDSVNVSVIEDADSTSGYAVSMLYNGVLVQTLYQKTIAGDNYMLSFRAKGLATITAMIGGVTSTIELDSADEYKKYVVSFEATQSTQQFVLRTNAETTLCEPQLERGTIATSWGNSYLDNQSDRAYYQAGVYVQQALHEGSTTIGGGLVLTNHIKVGDYANQEMVEETGGMSGTYANDDSVAFWAGGDFASAIDAVDKFKDDPTYQPTEEELASMANFVVTHGGRAILNDIILRGYVYAKGGNFQGKIDIDAKNVNGRVVIDDNGLVYYGTDGENGDYKRVALGSTCQAASGVFLAPNADASYCVPAALLAVGDESTRAIQADGDVLIEGNLSVLDGKVNATKIQVGEIVPSYGLDGLYLNIPNGMVMGLRTITKVVESSSVELNESDFSVLINMTSGSVTITFPSSPMDGQEYMIETKGADLTINSSTYIYNHYNGEWLTGSITNRGVIRFKYYDSARQWTMTWVDRY